jgi:two-component system cell cycle sensor histidine kinase/response regulator CckA
MGGRRVMIAEDDFPVRQFLAEYLSECGFQVDQAEDGDHAAAMLESAGDYGLLITDIDMPGRIDGNALAKQAKMRHPDLMVLYASGYPEQLRNKIGDYDAFLNKPFGPRQVLDLINEMLATRDMQPPLIHQRNKISAVNS